VNTVYEVYRRAGTGAYAKVGEAKAVATVTDMNARIPASLRAFLRREVLQDQNLPDDAALLSFLRNPQNLVRVGLMAEEYHQVALAVGLGFVDNSVPANAVVEYYVQVKGKPNLPIYGPVQVGPRATLARPANVREGTLYQGPADLGKQNSPRPVNAAERYQWDAAQAYRRAHGRALLLWDVPGEQDRRAAASATVTPSTIQTNYNIAGYVVYRKGPATNNQWVKANRLRDANNPSLGYRLIRPGSPEDPVTQGGKFYFEDKLTDVYSQTARTNPGQIFTDYQYRVCPVDFLGNEGPCSATVAVPIRDLVPPPSVHDLRVTADPQHTQLTLTWTYTATDESEPLRFYIMRSPDPTSLTEPAILASLPITDWVDITPNGLTQGGAATMTYRYTPPRKGLYWFRVQVRDNAGNWSAPGAPVKGGLYPRQKPHLPPIADQNQCDPNGLEVTFSGLDSAIKQLIVYRSFDPITNPNAPGVQVVQRIRVVNGQASFQDAYQPPISAVVYYKVEAMDGYGNVSDPRTFKARLCPPQRPDPPTGDKGPSQWDPDTLTYATTLTVTSPPAGVVTRTISTVRPSPQRLKTNVQTGPGTLRGTTVTSENGETVKVELKNSNERGDSPATTFWVRNVNNFLDTNRQMTDLGQPVAVEWRGNGTDPAVRVYLPSPADLPAPVPYVALFRRPSRGNWLQVTPVQDISQNFEVYQGITGTVVITDTADLDIYDSYTYVALAFSPLTFEVLGYWGPTTLPAWSSIDWVDLTPPLDPDPTYPTGPGCDLYDLRAPAYYQGEGWFIPEISLPNGWIIRVDRYRDYDGNCGGRDLSPDDLYGRGALLDSNGITVTSPVDFIGIGVDPSTLELQNGRIVATLNRSVSAAGRFDALFEKVEFQPGQANAQVVLSLPANVKVVDPTFVERSHRVRAVFPNARPDFTFDPVLVDTVEKPLLLVDENLPWQYNAALFTFEVGRVVPSHPVNTTDRLAYPPVPPAQTPPLPDNNLGFLRYAYTSNDMEVTPAGLQGTFNTNDDIMYITSLPAGVVVEADGAQVEVGDSQITRGQLHNASLALDYYTLGTDISYMSAKAGLLHVGTRRSLDGLRTLSMQPVRGHVSLAPGGILSTTVSVAPPSITWNETYTVPTTTPNLQVGFYAAAVSFPESGTAIGWTRLTSAPAPAENAWRKLPSGVSNAQLDPGLNLIGLSVEAECDCFRPSRFTDVDLDLYVRRGGVSGNFRINAQSYGEVKNKYGYFVTIKEYNLVFVDNAVVDGQARMDLRLPYPSDVVYPLRIRADGFDADGCPARGEIEQVKPYLHKYWAFSETPSRFFFSRLDGHVVDYVARYRQHHPGATDQEARRKLPGAIFVLQGRGVIEGLGKTTTRQSEVGKAVEVSIYHDWFPNGDYGDIRPYPQGKGPTDLPDYFRVSGVPYALTDIKLSRYYGKLMDKTSLPDTASVQLDQSVDALPKDLLDSQGRLTPQSLKACSKRDGGKGVGCGFILVDGNGAVVHFGEIDPNAPPATGEDAPKGKWPVATNMRRGQKTQMPARKQNLRWAYPIANTYIDRFLPVKLLVNDYGGALAGVAPNVRLLPGAEVLKTDLGVVVTVNFSSAQGFHMDFGLFAGYAATQSAIRALAMNRPGKNNVGIAPYQNWDDVKEDAEKWMKKFGYTTGSGDRDDPLDLAESVWSSWGTSSYTRTSSPRFGR